MEFFPPTEVAFSPLLYPHSRDLYPTYTIFRGTTNNTWATMAFPAGKVAIIDYLNVSSTNFEMRVAQAADPNNASIWAGYSNTYQGTQYLPPGLNTPIIVPAGVPLELYYANQASIRYYLVNDDSSIKPIIRILRPYNGTAPSGYDRTYVVPAGKKFVLLGAYSNSTSYGLRTWPSGTAGTGNDAHIFYGYQGYYSSNTMVQMQIPPAIFNAGEVLDCSGGTSSQWITIRGYEVTA